MAGLAKERRLHMRVRGRLVRLLGPPALFAVLGWVGPVRVEQPSFEFHHAAPVELSLPRLLSDARVAVSHHKCALTGGSRAREACRSDRGAAQDKLIQLAHLTAKAQSLHSQAMGLRPALDPLFADLTSRRPAPSAAANTFVFLLLASGLIILVFALFHGRAKRYHVHAAQAESEREDWVRQGTGLLQSREDLLTTFVRYVPAALAMLDREMRYLQVSDRWCSTFGIDRKTLIGHSHYEVFPDLPEQWKIAQQRCLAGETVRGDDDPWEHDGHTTWWRWEACPWEARPGHPGGMLVCIEDTTARKQSEMNLQSSEQKLRALAAKLLTAQEEERRKLARELHDDLTQQLAFLSMELGRLVGELPVTAKEARERLRALQIRTVHLSSEVRRISQGLHPSAIVDFGLTVALEGFCEQFGRAHGVKVLLECAGADVPLDPLQATCLYRIAQESLRNAVLHGHATEVAVSLRLVSNNEMRLQVQDNGIGFPESPAHSEAGLGTISMMERAHLVRGSLHITSQAGGGATVTVVLPLKEGRDEKIKDPAG